MIKRLPIIENNQNKGFGLSPPRSTPKLAVASGSSPKNTSESADVRYCSAKALKRGKPITTPTATINKGIICFCVGFLSLKIINPPKASNPAIVARETVRNIGFKSNTAILVAGREPLNNNTPIMPLIQPLDRIFVS
ncbi:hypothetical protein D3C87_1661520 [compost metagenome]